jgi:6,7-dimethyl-8-ribityllumazine synthase
VSDKSIADNIQGEGLKIAIVAAKFNEFITSRLLHGARVAFKDYGVNEKDTKVVWVPGSFEIPLAAKILADSRDFDAVVCLGAVIKGDTDHNEYIATQVARGISDVSLTTKIPVVFGVLTTDNVEQAIERVGGSDEEYTGVPRLSSKLDEEDNLAGHANGNSGYNFALTAIEMANLVRTIS